MNKKALYNALDEIENRLLELRDELDAETDNYEEVYEATEEALTQVQEAMEAVDAERFASR